MRRWLAGNWEIPASALVGLSFGVFLLIGHTSRPAVAPVAHRVACATNACQIERRDVRFFAKRGIAVSSEAVCRPLGSGESVCTVRIVGLELPFCYRETVASPEGAPLLVQPDMVRVSLPVCDAVLGNPPSD